MTPTAYEQGVNFYGFDFKVTSSTLIPRPETEQLVEKTLELAKNLSTKARIVDVGTGSGVIAATLAKKLPKAQIFAVDISNATLKTARENAESLGVQVEFRLGNLLEGIEGKFDLIIANLPYVPAARWQHLPSSVRDFEPKMAIVGGRDGLKLIRELVAQIPSHLSPNGIVALEIDDVKADRVLDLLEKALPKHRSLIEKDLAGFDRFAFALPN